jgi:heme-degrading monooxygenase HmoA
VQAKRRSIMHARLTTFESSPDDLSEAVKVAREQVLPLEREMPGFAGLGVFVDREAGRLVSLTLWRSEQEMRRSEDAARLVTRLAVREVGGKRVATEIMEVALLELAPQPAMSAPS